MITIMTCLDNNPTVVTEENNQRTNQTTLQWLIQHFTDKVIGSTTLAPLQRVNRMRYGSGKWTGFYTGYINEFAQPHDKGIIYYIDKDIYYGEWLNGKRHGEGIYNCVTGAQYDGEYNDDKMHGLGVYTFSDGKKFNSEWRNGKQC